MRNILIFIVIVFISSCGKKATDPAGTTTSSGSTKAVIKNGTTTVAHVVDFLERSRIFIYIPSASKYATVYLESGNYDINGSGLYFTDDDCSGTGYALGWIGELGKTVAFDGNNYWLISSRVSESLYPVTLKSYALRGVSSTSCVNNLMTNTTIFKYSGLLTATTRPYDFTAIAPLTITYE